MGDARTGQRERPGTVLKEKSKRAEDNRDGDCKEEGIKRPSTVVLPHQPGQSRRPLAMD